ncbi:MAG: hypothetical protein LBR73_00485 [Oscillospiraceae bacterium]|nr:hypothetical protein [Oscillospiraceae bacterium]
MSLSDTKRKHLRKYAVNYSALSLLCVLLTNVYALFGHGIRSQAMDLMFLYPLIGGSLVVTYCLCKELLPRTGFNLFNAGLTTLTVGAFLSGILEIAGTASPYIPGFYIIGGVLCAAGSIIALLPPTQTDAK